ncbi:MAG: aminotransferase class V-fold PLP-dependent enzyme [Balneolaceae bacterium]|nr:aminotransferase class V-fold PLP-dependent enzyme [Balneolaceae bacterium]MBO6546716.1 aminotransferase class V-fold PLP-dependent enzyme [Balneolaceae bacterium]MBO6649074.1 aminotransferase class V-fold PLP-dependent enzyme [Balneolaceae bacterium]
MNTSRKDFLKTISAGTSISALSLLTPIDSLFRKDLKETFSSRKLPAKKDYSLDSNIKYLNHGSTGTIPKIVLEAHQDYLKLCETNPWFYMWSGEWNDPIEKVRAKAAQYINAEIDEVSFPHNTTEVFNVLALGLELNKEDEVLFCNFSHAGASIPFLMHSKNLGYSVKTFDIPHDDLSSITKQDILALYEENITSKTRLIVIPHLDNTFGIRQPVKEITSLARSKGVEFVALDTAQTMGMIPIDVKDLDVDVIGTSAHKWIQAPKSISIAYFSKRIQDQINPMFVTWGQARWKDSARKFEDYGTRNLAQVLTLGHALDFQMSIDQRASKEKLQLLWRLSKELAMKNPNTVWRSPANWELSGSLFVIELKNRIPSEFAKAAFENNGYVFRPFDAYSTIRVSPNITTTEEEIEGLFRLV